jgi:hypothetical protein
MVQRFCQLTICQAEGIAVMGSQRYQCKARHPAGGSTKPRSSQPLSWAVKTVWGLLSLIPEAQRQPLAFQPVARAAKVWWRQSQAGNRFINLASASPRSCMGVRDGSLLLRSPIWHRCRLRDHRHGDHCSGGGPLGLLGCADPAPDSFSSGALACGPDPTLARPDLPATRPRQT